MFSKLIWTFEFGIRISSGKKDEFQPQAEACISYGRHQCQSSGCVEVYLSATTETVPMYQYSISGTLEGHGLFQGFLQSGGSREICLKFVSNV
jgi:hypothetical protein